MTLFKHGQVLQGKKYVSRNFGGKDQTRSEVKSAIVQKKIAVTWNFPHMIGMLRSTKYMVTMRSQVNSHVRFRLGIYVSYTPDVKVRRQRSHSANARLGKYLNKF